jgi:hypothetical protein
MSWTANADEGVKYFSGTATYNKTVQAPRTWFRPGTKILLDLGTAYDVATVSINGRTLETLWKQPYAIDITRALKPGNNQLEIKVTNEWTNRIIGDRSASPGKKILNVPAPPPGAPGAVSALPPSGLIGPVTIVSITQDR